MLRVVCRDVDIEVGTGLQNNGPVQKYIYIFGQKVL